MTTNFSQIFIPKRLRTFDVVSIALLMAMVFVLNRFTFTTQTLRFGFAFLAIGLLASWFGPIWTGIAAALTDVISTFINGIPYFPGFTLSAIIAAVVYGIFFYRAKITWWRVISASLIIMLIVNVLLNTWWLNILYHAPFMALIPVRLLKELITTPVQIILLYLLLNNSQIKHLTQRF